MIAREKRSRGKKKKISLSHMRPKPAPYAPDSVRSYKNLLLQKPKNNDRQGKKVTRQKEKKKKISLSRLRRNLAKLNSSPYYKTGTVSKLSSNFKTFIIFPQPKRF